MGNELTDHSALAQSTHSCDPQSPWQRGSEQNTNGLPGHYIPKGTDLSVHSHAYLNNMARQLDKLPDAKNNSASPALMLGTVIMILWKWQGYFYSGILPLLCAGAHVCSVARPRGDGAMS